MVEQSIDLSLMDVRVATGDEAHQSCLELVAPGRKTHTVSIALVTHLKRLLSV